jgi:hypothetical protein
VEAALKLFATAFGTLPDVDAQPDLTGVFDRTIASEAVEAHDGELTQEQRTAIENYLKPPADAVVISFGARGSGNNPGYIAARPGTFLGGAMAQVTDQRQAELKDMANNLRDIIALKLGFDIPAFDIVYADRPKDEKTFNGQYPLGGAHPNYDADGQNSGCVITIFNESTSEIDTVLRSLLAHEIFHCFQYVGYGTKANRDAAPAWIKEGQAAWVGQAVGGVSGKYDTFWNEYLLVPQKSLPTRSYDAIGFYAHLEESGISPWDAFKPMWAAGANSLAAYKEAGADAAAFVDSWAAGVTRQEARGAAWDTTGPGITTSAYAPLGVGISDGTKIDVSQPFFTNDVAEFEFGADMVHFTIEGHGRLNDGSLDTTALDNVWFCVDGHNCEKPCPEAPDPPAIAGTIAGTALLATSGGSDGTVGVVEGKDLEKDCQTPTPTATPDEFCNRYRDYVDWAKSNSSEDITKPLAAEIAQRFTDMQPFAPAQLVADVALMIRVYGTYAAAPEPIDIPLVGPDAAGIYKALTDMNAYCHVTF